MKEALYDIEIGGSITAKRKANTLRGLLNVTARARGSISVVNTATGKEVFFGTKDNLRYAVITAMEHDKSELE